MTTYRELVERSYSVIDEAVFGSYQGDYIFLVEGASNYGIVIAGYGSCTGCDALEAAVYGNAYSSGPDLAALDSLAEELRNSAHFGTVDELREYLLGKDGALRWYYHEDGFREAIEGLLAKVSN